MPTLTTNYSYTKPDVGVTDGTWGGNLNDNWDAIDADLFAVSGTASAALARTGGTMTGELKVLTEVYTLTDEGSALTGTVTLNLSTANFFALNTTGGGSISIDFDAANLPTSGDVYFVTIEVTAASGHTVSWPASVKWPSGSAPVQSAPGTDVYVLYTRDGGTTYYGNRAIEDAS